MQFILVYLSSFIFLAQLEATPEHSFRKIIIINKNNNVRTIMVTITIIKSSDSLHDIDSFLRDDEAIGIL